MVVVLAGQASQSVRLCLPTEKTKFNYTTSWESRMYTYAWNKLRNTEKKNPVILLTEVDIVVEWCSKCLHTHTQLEPRWGSDKNDATHGNTPTCRPALAIGAISPASWLKWASIGYSATSIKLEAPPPHHTFSQFRLMQWRRGQLRSHFCSVNGQLASQMLIQRLQNTLHKYYLYWTMLSL